MGARSFKLQEDDGSIVSNEKFVSFYNTVKDGNILTIGNYLINYVGMMNAYGEQDCYMSGLYFSDDQGWDPSKYTSNLGNRFGPCSTYFHQEKEMKVHTLNSGWFYNDLKKIDGDVGFTLTKIKETKGNFLLMKQYPDAMYGNWCTNGEVSTGFISLYENSELIEEKKAP